MAFRTHQDNDSRPRSSDMRHRGDDSPSDGRKQSRRIDPSEQQFRGRKRRHGAPRSISKSQKKLEKERRSAKSDRKAPNGAPNVILGPCSEAPYRRFLPSCEQNRATAASHKEKSVKRYEHLAGFRSDALNPLRTQRVYWARKESRAQSTIAHEFILEHSSKHRFDMALRLFH